MEVKFIARNPEFDLFKKKEIVDASIADGAEPARAEEFTTIGINACNAALEKVEEVIAASSDSEIAINAINVALHMLEVHVTSLQKALDEKSYAKQGCDCPNCQRVNSEADNISPSQRLN